MPPDGNRPRRRPSSCAEGQLDEPATTAMRTSRRHAVQRPLAVAVLSLFLLPSPCAAQKTDIIVLRNGDRFTGEIKSLQFGYLEVSTDSLSTVMVVWLDVVEVTSTHRFVVEVSSGQQHIGALQSPAPGTLQVGGPQTQPLGISDVVSIRPGRSDVLARIDGSLEVGFTVARANHQKQWALNGNAQYSGVRWFHVASASSAFTSQEGAENTSRNSISVQSGRFVANRWFYASLLQLQQDQQLGLDLRVGVGGGLGRWLIESNRRSLQVLGGFLVTRERFEGVAGTQTNVEGLMLWQYHAFRRRSPKVDTVVSFGLLPSLTDAGRVRGDFQLSVSLEVFKNVFVGLSGFDNFDSRPPDPTLTRNDYGLTPSLRWTF
jgi:hypothetical protein